MGQAGIFEPVIGRFQLIPADLSSKNFKKQAFFTKKLAIFFGKGLLWFLTKTFF